MTRSFSRARIALVAGAAFAGGLVVASGFNVTPFGYAQQGHATTLRPSAQEVKPLTDASNTFVAIAERVTPAVVAVSTSQNARPSPRRRQQGVPQDLQDFFDQFDNPRRGPVEGAGSGFIVTPDGYILTNNHVVADADRVTVALTDHRVFDAKVVGRDPSTDVAVIKIDAANLPTVPLGNDDQARVGEWVLAIGNPLGLDFTVTAGIVSAKHRSSTSLARLFPTNYAIVDYIQTDAAINPGNSGGPLVNTRGEVIGINSAIASPTGTYAGYGFAIPITLAKTAMDDLIRYGKARRAILGVSIQEVTPEDAQSAGLKEIRGAIVEGFNPPANSPAKRAGLEPGDIIVAIDGIPVDRVSELQRIVRAKKPGDNATVDVMRFGARKTFTVRLTEAEPEAQVASTDRGRGQADQEPVYDKVGVSVKPLSEADATQARIDQDYRGVVVTDVDPNGPASGRLFPSDVIVTVLNPTKQQVKSASDLDGVLGRMHRGDVVSLLVYNVQNKVTRVVNLRVGS